MRKDKLNINKILHNWYIIKTLESVEALYVTIPIEQALQKLSDNGELKEDDFMILDAYQKGYNLREIAKITKITRQTIAVRLESIFLRVQSILGSEYHVY